jgi:hypothetical protein
MPVKNCCVITKPCGRRERARVANWDIIMGRHGPRGSCGKKALNLQILKVLYVQYVEIKQLQASLCPAGYGASGVSSKVHGRQSISGTVKPLKKGSVKPFRSSDGDRSDVQMLSYELFSIQPNYHKYQ